MGGPSGYRYDIFLSYPRGGLVEPFVREVFVDLLRRALADQHPVSAPQIFVDEQGVAVGERISDALREALRRSKLLLVLVNPAYARKQWCREEWASFSGRTGPAEHPRRWSLLLQDGEHLAPCYEADKADRRFKAPGLLLTDPAHIRGEKGQLLVELVNQLAAELVARLLALDAHLPPEPDPLPDPLDLPALYGGPGAIPRLVGPHV